MENKYLETDIPIGELRKLGLIKNGRPDLAREDLDALLTGHRTDLITLHDLHGDGIHIQKIDAKLSLHRDDNGHMSIQIHPIYRDAKRHPLLLEVEAEQLELGSLTHVMKTYQTPEGKKSWVIEYDPETKEFISSDPQKVEVPDKINNESLSAIQKEQYRNGNIFELSDGTMIQRRASKRSGITSNRTALVYSMLFDGGVSYLLLRSLTNLLNSRKEQLDPYTEGYNRAWKDMQQQQQKMFTENSADRAAVHDRDLKISKEYRKNVSR